MKNRIRIVIALLMVVTCRSLEAQPSQDLVNRMMPKPVPASPNVAALGKFGDYQVSHFSGLPEISIPIYEAQSGELKLPITLSYHASGVKPTDQASWVGLGWSLSAGGQISRAIVGKADEEGFLSEALNPNPSVCGTYAYLLHAATGVSDTEADVFSYSFGGNSGRFLWTYDGGPYLIPYAPININAPATSFGKFDITDENGILYKFGEDAAGASVVEVTTATNGGNPAYNATTGWPLTQMIAPNSNDQITIDYQDVGTFYTHDISYSYVVMDQCYANASGTCPTNTFAPQQHNNDSYGPQKAPEVITFETGKVKFILGNFRSDAGSLKYLDRIEIQRLDGTVLKTVKFIYSYFTGVSGGNAALKLDQVRFLDNAGVVTQKYTFEYFTNSFSWDRNDPDDLNARDLWGYYNGATTNTDLLVPRTISYSQTLGSPGTDLTFGGGTDRTVHAQYVKEGVLKRINYPTGGYTEFDFESNKYLNNGTPTPCGGLRVTKITSSDGGSAPPVVKTYRYGDTAGTPESGNGLPNFAELEFNYSNTQQIYSGTECGVGVNPYVEYQLRTFHSNSAFSTDPFDSSPVKYPYVTEYSGDPSGTTNGKITYVYDNGSPTGDVNHVVPNSGKYFRNSFFWKRGKLTSKTVYDKLNNKLSETSVIYSPFQETSKYVGLGVHQFVPSGYTCASGSSCFNELGEEIAANAFYFTTYYLNSGVLMETSVSETTFENGNINNSVAKSTGRTFEATNLQPTLITTSANNGEVLKTVNRYPFQLTANASSTGNAKGIYMLTGKHILVTPVETYTYLVKGSVENLVSAQATTYRQNEANPDQVVPDQIYVWEPSRASVAKSTYAEMAINGANNGVTMDDDLTPRIKMVSYNADGEILAARKSDDLPMSYQYGYDNALPVAEVTNAQDTRYTTQTTASTAITVGGPSPVTSSPIVFTVDYAGDVRLKLGVSGTPAFTTYVDYSGSLGNGSMTLGTGSCANTEVLFSNVSAGQKTIYVTVRTATAGTSVGACGQVEYPHITASGFTEFVYENFEEGTTTTSPLVAHTGKGYLNGDYSPAFVIPNSRSYNIEYWYWDGTKWVYTSKPYTGTSTLVNEGTAIDDVRIYPSDALMKSYTHDPMLGITSVISENGLVTYYDYDAFGRLWRVKNHKGELEKQYSYHYKGN